MEMGLTIWEILTVDMDIDMDKANKDGTSPAYIRAQLGNIDLSDSHVS